MRPSVKEIIDGMSWVLDTRVAPHVTQKWAESYLRSIKGLLLHLSERVEKEGELLFNDNQVVRELLKRQLERIVDSDDEVWVDLGRETAEALQKQWRKPEVYLTVASLEEENLCYRRIVDSLIKAVHENGSSLPAGVTSLIHEETVVYLKEKIEKEKDLYDPAFSGSPY